MTTTELVNETPMPKTAEAQSKEEGIDTMPSTMTTQQSEIEKKLYESWPFLLLVFGVATYACVCMIGLVVGMTVVHMS